jgi:hypothetical protein
MKVYTKYITLRNGRKLFAHEVGKEAFCFEVDDEEHQRYLDKKSEEKEK